jgi:hypothetical protein
MCSNSIIEQAGRKVLRFRDLNEQVGERPASEIFRDSQIEPLKISMTPSIARDRSSLTPDENPIDVVNFLMMFSLLSQGAGDKSKQEAESDRKRSGSTNSDSSGDSDLREKDKKLKKKGSVFGNIFGKKSRKASKDEKDSAVEPKIMRAMVGTPESGASGVDDSTRSELTPSITEDEGSLAGSGARDQEGPISWTKKLPVEKEPVYSLWVSSLLKSRTSALNCQWTPMRMVLTVSNRRLRMQVAVLPHHPFPGQMPPYIHS